MLVDLLDNTNNKALVYTLKISSDANQKLVENAEQFGQLLAQTLSEKEPETIKAKNNIGCYITTTIYMLKHILNVLFILVIKAEIATADAIEKLEGKPLKFPDEDDKKEINDSFQGLSAQIAIPAELLSDALDATSRPIKLSMVFYLYYLLDGTKLPIVNTVFRNLASVLPSVSSNEYDLFISQRFILYLYYFSVATRPVSAVLSSQLSKTKRFTTSVPIELTFAVNKVWSCNRFLSYALHGFLLKGGGF